MPNTPNDNLEGVNNTISSSYGKSMSDAPAFDKEAAMAAYEADHPDAVRDPEKARAMAEAGDKYRTEAAELRQKEGALLSAAEYFDDKKERFSSYPKEAEEAFSAQITLENEASAINGSARARDYQAETHEDHVGEEYDKYHAQENKI